MYMYNYTEMARVTGVPMSFLLTRGQSIKVFSQILRKARQRNLLVPFLKVCSCLVQLLCQLAFVCYCLTGFRHRRDQSTAPACIMLFLFMHGILRVMGQRLGMTGQQLTAPEIICLFLMAGGWAA